MDAAVCTLRIHCFPEYLKSLHLILQDIYHRLYLLKLLLQRVNMDIYAQVPAPPLHVNVDFRSGYRFQSINYLLKYCFLKMCAYLLAGKVPSFQNYANKSIQNRYNMYVKGYSYKAVFTFISKD